MNKKEIIFILGSGRCGTYSFHKALECLENFDSKHEFFFEPTLRIATLYQMNQISKSSVIKFLKENHLYSINNSKKKIWINSCNALPWISDILVEIFPEAKFIHLVRNGKKVVSSFYNKFNDEMYEKKNIQKLINFLQNQKKNRISSEKKYWRPLPINDMKELNKFIKLGQFYRICKYWNDINIKIENSLKNSQKKIFIKLEDIVNEKNNSNIANFLKVKKTDLKNFNNSFKTPTNVALPKNIMLSKYQTKIFNRVCKNQMIKYNYSDEEYYVKYSK